MEITHLLKGIAVKVANGWLTEVEQQPSPHFDQRLASILTEETQVEANVQAEQQVSLLVVHNISLPPAKFDGDYITDFFLGKLDPSADPYFETIYQMRVSAHCLIRRDGKIIQYVSFNDRAWHAGISNYLGKEKCNDFSIGIELEGTDDLPYTQQQYSQLAKVTLLLQQNYPLLQKNIVGHCDIAPGRKTDPGEIFDWPHFYSLLKSD
jgi:AmpD protein